MLALVPTCRLPVTLVSSHRPPHRPPASHKVMRVAPVAAEILPIWFSGQSLPWSSAASAENLSVREYAFPRSQSNWRHGNLMWYRQSHDDEGGQRLTRRRALQGAALAAGIVLAGTGAWSFRQSSDGSLSEADAQLLAWPREDRWPDLFDQVPASVQDLYRYAAANRETLKWLPCFCGCVDQGHTSNFDCFVKQVRGDGSIVLDTMSFT